VSVAVAARAPGKLFITGEYAVLAGAPALVAAVDRYAEVRVRLGDEAGSLLVESLADGGRRPGRATAEGGDAAAVVAALRACAARASRLDGRRCHVLVDSRALLAGERKLGLGRSAATVTAAVAAFLAAVGHGDAAETFTTAVAAHSLFQDGRGSGADVAAAVHGGVVECRRVEGRLVIARRALPPGLHLVVGWTGEAAPTAALVERFGAGGRERGVLGELSAAAEGAAEAAAGHDARALVASVARSAELLERLGRELGIPIVTPALARLVAAARRVGAVAKPSGAGGGDCGIALADSATQAAAVRAAWEGEGIVPLPVTIAVEGVRTDRPAQAAGEVSLG